MEKENKHHIAEELKALGSSLDPPGNDQGFRVPEAYFDQLHGSIQDRIKEKGQRQFAGFTVPGAQRLVPLMATFLLALIVGISLLWIRDDGLNGQLALEPDREALDYYAMEMDQLLLYDLVLDSDITAEDILFGLDNGLGELSLYDDELMEELFEQSRYFGIDSQYLLSSLD